MSSLYHRRRGLWLPGQAPPPSVAVELDRGHQLASGLVALWPLTGDYRDYSPTGAHGTPYGAVKQSGAIGACTAFAGTGQYVDFGSPAALALTGDCTITALINLDRSWAQVQNILCHYNNTAFAFQLDNAGALYLGSYGITGIVGCSLPATGWVHVAGRRSGTSFTLYVNGALGATTTFADGFTATGSLRCGAGLYSQNAKGQVADIKVWNRPLSAAEISADAAAPWGMLRPAARRAYSSGISVVALSLGDTAATTDAASAAGRSGAFASDVGATADTVSAALSAVGLSASDAASASDTASAAMRGAVSAADAASTADATSAATRASAAPSDAAATGDAASAAMRGAVSATDAASTADTPASMAAGTYSATAVDSGLGGDTTSAAVTASAALSDAAATGDAASAAMRGAVSAADVASTADTPASMAVGTYSDTPVPVAIYDAAATGDAVSAAMRGAASATDAASTADTLIVWLGSPVSQGAPRNVTPEIYPPGGGLGAVLPPPPEAIPPLRVVAGVDVVCRTVSAVVQRPAVRVDAWGADPVVRAVPD